MKPENLELLLLDRALGQLPPETAELLEEHLRGNPSAATRASALAVTVSRARTAVCSGAVAADAPLSGWARARRTARWRAWTAQGWKLAACVALGLMLGWSLRRPAHAPVAVASFTPATQSHAGRSRALNPAAAFWIAERRAAEANDRVPPPKALPWEVLEISRAKGERR
jgi:hypothetical protein